MKTDDFEILKTKLLHEIQKNDMHQACIYEILPKIDYLLPMTSKKIENLDIDNKARFALINERFSKLQDSIGEKIFKNVLLLLKEQIAHKSFIDILNKLEKLEILDSVEGWDRFRELRNDLVHEYPDEFEDRANNINEAVSCAKELCTYWQKLKTFILDKIDEQK